METACGAGTMEAKVNTVSSTAECRSGEVAMEVLKVKEEPDVGFLAVEVLKVKEEPDVGFGKSEDLCGKTSNLKQEMTMAVVRVKEEPTKVKEEPIVYGETNKSVIVVKEKVQDLICVEPLSARKLSDAEYRSMQSQYVNPKSKRVMAVTSAVIEDGDFPEDPAWLLVGGIIVTGLSTTKGRKLEDNEIVHFSFPSANTKTKIVRFSTKRNGEVGRLPIEWGKCLIPLVNSTKVKVLGRCVAAPINLCIMQDIMLHMSFYVNESIFSEAENIDAIIFQLLKVRQSQKVSLQSTIIVEEVYSRKRSLDIDSTVQARKQRMIAGAQTHEQLRSARLNELKMLFR